MKKAFLVVLMLSSSLIFAQDTISGSVSDESNNPIPGATIAIEGTTTGVVTDFDGNYQINASAGDQLTFSSLGFASQTVTIGNQTQINIVLASSVDILDEVVVSGYQTQQRRSLSGAIGTLDTEEAIKTQVTNAAEALQGRVAGVSVVSGGAPGAAVVPGSASIRSSIRSSSSSSSCFSVMCLFTIDNSVFKRLINLPIFALPSVVKVFNLSYGITLRAASNLFLEAINVFKSCER